MFGATDIVKKSDKIKWVYSGYGIASGPGSQNFDNDFAKNAVIFCLDTSSSFDTEIVRRIF